MGGSKDTNEKNWLVRSSSRILGPYSMMEIAQLLIKKYISIIDEVRQPTGRWSYIRENTMFAEIVQKLRHEQANAPEETVSTSPGTQTQTLSKTDWVPSSDSMTPTPLIKSNVSYPYGGQEIKDVSPTKEFGSLPDLNRDAEKSFGAVGDQRLQEKLEHKSRSFGFLLWAFTMLIAAGISFFVVKKFRSGGEDFDGLIAEALRYKHIMLYEEAVESFKKAQAIDDPDNKVSFELAPLLIQMEKQTLLYRRVLENGITRSGLSSEEIVDAYVGIALSYSLEGDFKAAKDNLNKALQIAPGNFPALINSAYLELRTGNFKRAEKIFSGMLPTATFAPYIQLGRAILAVESERKDADELMQRMEESLKEPQTIHKEQSLLLAYLYFLEERFEKMQETMRMVIDMRLFQNRMFVRDPRIDMRISGWDYLEKYCVDLYTRAQAQALGKAFRAVCLLEQGRDAEAKSLIDEAIVENPKDPYVLMAQAHYLSKIGKHREVLTLLRQSSLASLKITPLMIANSCEEIKDLNCARSTIDAAYRKDPQDIRYLTEWARLHLDTPQSNEVWEVVKRGFELNSYYLPLIRLRDRMENP